MKIVLPFKINNTNNRKYLRQNDKRISSFRQQIEVGNDFGKEVMKTNTRAATTIIRLMSSERAKTGC